MSFTYNNVNCESLGMFVEKYPNRPFPTKKVTTYNILGRNGDLIVEHGGYNNVIQEYEVYVNSSGSGLHANIANIAYWLLYGVTGYAVLTDTYDTSIYREARVINGEAFINSLNQYGKATLQFDCKPQRFINPQEKFVLAPSDRETIPVITNVIGDSPLIEIRSLSSGETIQVGWNKIGSTDWSYIAFPSISGPIGGINIDLELKAVYDPYNQTSVSHTKNKPDSDFNWKCGGGYQVELTATNSSTRATVYTRRFYL